jgi:protein-S-isoprenylcysteine O-methyltransferase Ste14
MAARARRRRGLLALVSLGSFALWIGLGVLGWGSWMGFLAHPARALLVVLALGMTLVALASPINLSSGDREDVASRWIFVPAAAGTLLLFWLLPYLDRRDLWTLDGDTARYSGLALLLVGGVVRIWPMFVLGPRFSGLVAIQPGHELVTRGPYRWIRHPSYLGMLLGLVGFALIFRSAVGLVAAALGLPLLAARIDAEEALLAAHFGAAYDAYRARTWRLLPGLY